MYCIKCGQQLPDDARFCFKCGAATAQQNGAAYGAQSFNDAVAAKAESFAATDNISRGRNSFFSKFDDVSDGGKGVYIVRKGEKYGYVFQEGNTFDYRIRCQLDSAKAFAGDLANVKYQGKKYCIDKKGNLMNERWTNELVEDFESNLLVLLIYLIFIGSMIYICVPIVGGIYYFVGDFEYPDGFWNKFDLWKEICYSEPIVMKISIGVGVVIAIIHFLTKMYCRLDNTGINLRTKSNTK